MCNYFIVDVGLLPLQKKKKKKKKEKKKHEA